jgi:hypothetical protein
MSPVDAYARASRQRRIADLIADADPYDVKVATHVITDGRMVVGRHRDFFVALAAAAEDDVIMDALAQVAAKRKLERDLDVSMELGKTVDR